MNASYEDTVREYECAPSECVHCFVATAIGVWWCSTHRQLFFWDREAEEPLNLLELPEVPSLLAATDEGGLLTVGVSHATLYQLHIVEEEDEESGETSIAYEVETVGTVTCSVQGAVTAELYSDGSIAAVTTADGLVLLNLSLFLSPEERSRDEEVSVSFSCEAFFQSPQCARCCFLAPDRLALISATNHLVVVTPDFRQRQVGLERDGQMIVLGPHVPLSMSCHDNVLVVGLSDGTVRLIQASTLKVFKTFDIIKELEAVVSAGTTADANPKPWQIRKKNVSQQILDKKSPSAQVNFHPVVESTAVGDRLITVATPDAVVLIVKDSLEIDKSRISFVHDLPFSESGAPLSNKAQQLRCAPDGSWASWDPFVSTVQYAVSDFGLHDVANDDVVHAKEPLPAKWLQPLQPPQAKKTPDTGKTKGPPGRAVRPPKGSGYGAAPWSVAQQSKKAKQQKEKKKQGQIDSKPDVKKYKLLVPYKDHKFTAMSNTNRSLGSVHNTVSSLLFTSTGKTLLSTGKGEMIRVIKYPVSTSKTNVTSLKPTGEEVLSMDCNLSMQKPLILTSGTKGQLCVYSLGSNNAPLIDVQLPAPPGKNENRDVRSAKFFFIDKFITYTLQNQFHLSKYVVNSPDEEWAAVPRRSMLGEPTFTYTFESAQHISAMNVVNQITSSLILLAGTNKELQVVDVISGSSLWHCEEAHSRAIHHVEVNSAGRFASLGSALHHEFYTAGMDNAVHLWDMRLSGKVRQFALHKNSSLPSVGLAVSPEGERIAVGSEDRSIYLYDVRQGSTPLDVISTGNGVPLALAWNPLDPVLCAGLSSGEVLFYGQK